MWGFPGGSVLRMQGPDLKAGFCRGFRTRGLSGLAEAEFVRLLRGKVDLPTPLATLHSLEQNKKINNPILKIGKDLN